VAEARAGGFLPPVFGFVSILRDPLEDGIVQEHAWVQRCAESGRAIAKLWTSRPLLVVPRSYERSANFEAACDASAAQGWPVRVRTSGGGVVPQGPGVWNLSLLWHAASAAPAEPDSVYRWLCAELAGAFAAMAIDLAPQPVAGSFCDGRFNLAHRGAKLIGTAQSWRRVGRAHVVLAHAVMLIDADTTVLTERCNTFESALGRPQRYRADAVSTVAAVWRAARGNPAPPSLTEDVCKAIAQRLARVTSKCGFATLLDPRGGRPASAGHGALINPTPKN
jgi:lipoate-protein ligase A